MGFFKGIINVYIKQSRDNLDKQKNQVCENIAAKVNELIKEKKLQDDD